MRSGFIFLAALSGLSGVAMGAFGAHALKAVLSPEMLAVYQTGVNYQMWHALALLGVGLARLQFPDAKLLHWAGVLMVIGILLFSGSLYTLAVLDLKWLGMITPVGGVSFIIAWLLITLFAAQKPQQSRYTDARR